MTHAHDTPMAPLVIDAHADYLELIAQLGGQVLDLGTGNGAPAREVRP